MRVTLRAVADPRLHRYTRALDEIFANHALLLHSALDLLAVSWRSERLTEERRKLGGTGGQGERLAQLVREVKALVVQRPAAPIGGLRQRS